MKVRIDRTRCIGAGHCARTVPEVFDQDDREGLVVLIDAEPPAHLADEVRKAARLCPARVIEIVE